MTVFWNDVRIALRTLAREPSFSLIVILTLAVGVGASTLIYSVAHATLFEPLPYPDQDRIVFVASELEPDGSLVMSSYADVQDWRARMESIERLGVARTGTVMLTGRDEPQRLFARYVDAEYLRILGARAQQGRLFDAGDNRAPGAHAVALVSHGLWHGRFGGDPKLVGRAIGLSGRHFTVVGVLEPAFREPFPGGLDGTLDVWLPLMMSGPSHPAGDRILTERRWRPFEVFARLRPGVSPEHAEVELDAIADTLEQEFPDVNRGFGVGVQLLSSLLTFEIRTPLLLLLAGAALLLGIGCFNVANLMLVRAAGRRRQIAVRVALGASRRTLMRGVAAEALVLASVGGGLGTLAAVAALPLLLRVNPIQLPILADVRIDASVLLLSCGASLVAGALFAIAPSIRIGDLDLSKHLAGSGRHGVDRRGARVRNGLVVFEIATATMLLAASTMLVMNFYELSRADSGFRPEQLQTLRLRLAPAAYPDTSDVVQAAEALRERLSALPGVQWADAWGPGRPGLSFFYQATVPRGQIVERMSDASIGRRHSIGPGALRRLGIPLIRGREFTPSDTPEAQPVIVVSRSLAEELWPNEDPVGRRVLPFRTHRSGAPQWTVVGIVADARHGGRVASVGGVATDNDIYFPLTQRAERDLTLLVRSEQAPDVGAVRAAVQSFDPDIPMFDAATIDQLFEGEQSPARFAALLMAAFASAALLLAGLGVYSVLAYSVNQQTHEIALRSALGADGGTIVRGVLTQGLRLAGSGLLLGSLLALASERVITSLSDVYTGADAVALGTASLALTVVAILACLIPAVRAARISPARVLRA